VSNFASYDNLSARCLLRNLVDSVTDRRTNSVNDMSPRVAGGEGDNVCRSTSTTFDKVFHTTLLLGRLTLLSKKATMSMQHSISLLVERIIPVVGIGQSTLLLHGVDGALRCQSQAYIHAPIISNLRFRHNYRQHCAQRKPAGI